MSRTNARTRPGYAERRALRMQQRVEKWEARRNGPPPPAHVHRAVVSLLLMAASLALAWMIAFGTPGGGA